MVFEHTVTDGVMRVNFMGSLFGPSIEDYDNVMANIIDKLMEEKKVISIVLSETRDYEYDAEQTRMLVEIADALNEILRSKLVSTRNIVPPDRLCQKYLGTWYTWLHDTVTIQLRGDPIGAYVNLIREMRHLRAKAAHAEPEDVICYKHYLENALMPLQAILEKCTLIQKAKPFLTAYKIADRTLYRKFFHPTIRPNFMYTKFMTLPPAGGQTIARYKIRDADVEIFRVPGKIRPVYFITPPEFRLSETEYTLLDAARRVLEERRPRELEMREQEKLRELFRTLSLDLLRDLSETMHLNHEEAEMEKLADILTRHTAGLGVIELLLADDKIQDIFINSPMGELPIYINHQDFEECETNLVPTKADGDRWATRFRLISGRPLDEANPVLDTEIAVPGGVARVTAINPRLSPEGIAYALRRHRFKPWTFPLFINEKMFNPMFGGLMWFMASYGRTILIAGTRGAGKSSLLGSLMLQILPYYRIISSEDTFELPVEALRELGYNIERLKSRSVITRVELELPAEEVLRTALRLGDSCLFIGEVRSVEAKALYEAMRIGAMANVVAGTIHGESAYGVFDRVVNDLGVPPTSFKATDLVVICNKLRTPDGLRTFRRVTEVTEVRKHWQRDPVEENGFVNLMEYSSNEDTLRPTDTLLNGESFILNQIAMRTPGWAGRWERVWDNIGLRAKVLQTIVDIANQTGRKELMEAPTCVLSNQKFHELAERSRTETGIVDSERVYNEWLEWFKSIAKK
ncbi:MAG: type II/IV secretion system ATPase subunit [Candidatus Aenigmatarchaeota archaeon]|nr:type II/IV secretion system ATPase subunit [Candidatus Aenigmarchaeota archaeon]